jgi:uncharacterized Ntn-hydrolase superfamily protein
MQSSRIAVFASLALWVVPVSLAQATYSIVASDVRTRQVGGAGASCVYPNQVSIIFGVAPGLGAVHAQAQANTAGRDRAVEMLRMGESPDAVLRAITSASFDNLVARRQYGVVDVMGRAGGFSGGQNMAFSDDVQGMHDGYAFSVQGNILTGVEVLTQSIRGFESGGCDLAEHLMLALEAGARNGQGDTRCTPSGIAANSAFIQVDLPGMPAGSYLKLSAGSARTADPLPALRTAFDAWRRTHPCMRVIDGGVDAAVDGGASPEAGLADAARPVSDAASAEDATISADASMHMDAASSPGSLVDASALGSDASSSGDAVASGVDAASAPGVMAGDSDDAGGCSTRVGRTRANEGGFGLACLALFALLRSGRGAFRSARRSPASSGSYRRSPPPAP